MIGNVQILLQRTPFDRVSSYFAENYTYTPGNMLATYTDGTVTQENLYTGEGQRVQKKEGSDVTNYFYQEGSVLYTTDASGSLKAFNLLNVSDAFGTERKSGTSETYYLYTEDLKGSTVNVLDNSAAAVVSYWYDDFGEVTESKASGYSGFDNELQYTGAVYDASTGLLYLNARFYDPQTGRFISRDTYRGERNAADTWHLYLYCANNPVNYVDPSGHYAIGLPLVIGTILVIGYVITYSYIQGNISIGNTTVKNFRFKFNKRNNNHYDIKIQFHGPDRYNHKSGVASMRARWNSLKKSKRTKILLFAKNHRWRYHMHIRIIKNKKLVKTITL